jgi:hypothetical protein
MQRGHGRLAKRARNTNGLKNQKKDPTPVPETRSSSSETPHSPGNDNEIIDNCWLSDAAAVHTARLFGYEEAWSHDDDEAEEGEEWDANEEVAEWELDDGAFDDEELCEKMYRYASAMGNEPRDEDCPT